MKSIGSVKVRGEQYEIHVDTSDGKFSATVDGDEISHVTLQGLKDRLLDVTRPQAKINITFWRVATGQFSEKPDNPIRIVRGAITGRHAANGNLLVFIGGSREQEYYVKKSRRYLSLKAGEENEYAAMLVASENAQKAVEKFEEKHALDVEAEISKASKPKVKK